MKAARPACLLRLRSSVPEWREHSSTAADKRKERLHRLRKEMAGLRYSEYVAGDGPRFRQHACQLGLEGAISKGADQT
jgi:ATP-dependent DNA ligase